MSRSISHWSISYFQSIHFNPSRTVDFTTNFMELLFYFFIVLLLSIYRSFSVFMVAFYSEIPIGNALYLLTNKRYIELNQKRNRAFHLLTFFFFFLFFINRKCHYGDLSEYQIHHISIPWYPNLKIENSHFICFFHCTFLNHEFKD